MKNIICMYVLALMPLLAFSQSFTGKLRHKPWAKSMQSYCAQGSDYYVLEMRSGEHVLEFAEGVPDNINRYTDKSVIIRGELVRKTIPASQNPMEQRPVTITPNGTSAADVSCEVLRVKQMKRK